MAQLTDFGKNVKIRLIMIGQTQTWLIEQVKEKTGMFFDDSYLHKLLVGSRGAPKLVKAICEILEIEAPTKDAKGETNGTED